MLKDTNIKNNKSSILKTALLGGLKGGLRLEATSAVGIAIDMIMERFERGIQISWKKSKEKIYFEKWGRRKVWVRC